VRLLIISNSSARVIIDSAANVNVMLSSSPEGFHTSQIKRKVSGLPHMFSLGFRKSKLSEGNIDSGGDIECV
jgi:hypothetical protein